MTAALEVTKKEKDDKEGAPYTAGLLLCELLEAVEVLENHVRLGDNAWADAKLSVAVLADHAQRIRKQALAEDLVRPFTGEDGTAGQLSIGEALMDADTDSYHASELRAAVGESFPSYTRAELAGAVRQVRGPDLAQISPDLDEKLEAVQHFFEVKNCIPDRVRRPSSYTKEDA